MPQMFYYIEELSLVDWDTIAIYTCTNVECLPDFKKAEGRYIDEYAYIQFSNDFKNV
jgi:hypothetical protein